MNRRQAEKTTPRASPRQPHAEADPHPSTTRHPEFTPPSRPQWFAALTPRGHTRCITPTEKETRNARSLSPPFPSRPRKERQLHATASTKYKGSIHLHCNVCVL
ncbi:hypothetical protein TcCL_ESM11356, partial [Trypanosoma cruzi]